MGKSVAKIIGVVALVASFFVPGGIFLSGGILGSSYLAISFATILTGIAAISISIGFSPEFDLGDLGQQLAENLHISNSPVAVRSVGLGRFGIAGQVLFRKNIENSGDTPDELLVILQLAGFPCTALEKFWLNGELVFDGDSTTGPGAITTGTFANDLWVWFRTGEEVTAAFPEIAALSTEWNLKTRILRGQCCIGIRVRVTEDMEGRFEPLAQVRGAKLYDPRLDSTVPGGSGAHRFADPTTWEWSENPKLAELLYLRGGEVNGVSIFGMGKPAEAIDIEHMASEANICEEQIAVTAGGTINRYTLNGLLIPSRNHRTNLKMLLSASAGTMDASTGVYRSFAGAWRAPSMTLTESDIDGAPTEIRLQKDPAEEVNIIIGSFADPVDKWQVKEYPERRDDISIAQVGENSITLDLPFTTDHRTCQRIAKIEMFRVNAARAFSASYWLRTLALQPGDIVTQTYSRYGINAETFRVGMWGVQANEDRDGSRRLIVPMQLVEEQQSWFDWDAGTEEQQTTTITSLPSIDRNPKMITLDGATAFEGPLPPANPKVGWLWRDTDTNIVFRWSGAAWVDYATQTTTADQIDYLSGASVESLEPAEPDSDVTAPRVLGNGLVNPSFETGTLDGWAPVTGGAVWAVTTTDPRSGTYNLESTSSVNARIRNLSRLQVSEGKRVQAEGFVQTAGVGSGNVRVGLRFRDAAGALVGSFFGATNTGTAYALSRADGVAPAGAVIADFEFEQFSMVGRMALCDGAHIQIVPNVGIDQIDEQSVTETFGTTRDMGVTGTIFSSGGSPHDILSIPGVVVPESATGVAVMMVGRIDNAAGAGSDVRLRATWSGGSAESHTIPVEGSVTEGGLTLQHTFDTIPADATATIVARLTVAAGESLFVHKLRLNAELLKR